MMKKRWIGIAAGLIVLAMLVPAYSEMDDGGSREYSALLYRVTFRHSVAQQGGESGYLTGTEVRVLGMEVYNDALFIPSGGK